MTQPENHLANLTSAQIGSTANALFKIGILTVGTQLGTELIHKMAKHPLALFSLGFAIGAYAHVNRKKIIASAKQLKSNRLK